MKEFYELIASEFRFIFESMSIITLLQILLLSFLYLYLIWLIKPYIAYKKIKLVDKSQVDNTTKGEFDDYVFPITLEDIKEVLKIVRKKKPRALIGISEIRLMNREEAKIVAKVKEAIVGTYFPNINNPRKGSPIFLYPIKYNEKNKEFYLRDRMDSYRVLSWEEARDLMIFTLLHEIGHNYYYVTKYRIDESVEELCDEFAKDIGIVEDIMLVPRDLVKTININSYNK